MSRIEFEPLELDLDWESDERETMPSVDVAASSLRTLLPPPSGAEWVRLSEVAESEAWGLEWIEDINETPNMFSFHEQLTAAETPDAKHKDTLRAAPPPPSNGPGPACSVTVPRPGRRSREQLVRDAISVVTLMARRRAV